ncbi:HotDog domain-containing protein, partial [Dimargaris cristalligena]
ATKELALAAHFTMAARDKETQKKAKINPLLLHTEKEKRISAIADDLRRRKIQRAEHSLLKVPPSAEERELMHKLYLESNEYTGKSQQHRFVSSKKPDNVVWADATKIESFIVTMPEDQNVHGKIFGGYLMRLALELSFAEAHLFSRQIPRLLAIDDIAFKMPVPIGSMLNLAAQVTYSSGLPGASFEVSVTADVISPSSRTRVTTNVFHLTFKMAEDQSAPRVIPRTYADLMKYIEANRRYEQHKDTFTLPHEFIDD